MGTNIPVLGFLAVCFGSGNTLQSFVSALLHPLVGFPRLFGAFLVDVVRSIGLLPVRLPPTRDALVHSVGVIATAALGQVRFPVQDIDGVVVRRVLLRGVIADGPAVGRVVAQGEFQGADHLLGCAAAFYMVWGMVGWHGVFGWHEILACASMLPEMAPPIFNGQHQS